MPDIIPSIKSDAEPVSSASVQPTSQNAATAGALAQAHGDKKNFDANTNISSLEQLKEKAPEVYHQMMLGIATTICRKMHRDDERLKKMMREGRQQH